MVAGILFFAVSVLFDGDPPDDTDLLLPPLPQVHGAKHTDTVLRLMSRRITNLPPEFHREIDPPLLVAMTEFYEGKADLFQRLESVLESPVGRIRRVGVGADPSIDVWERVYLLFEGRARWNRHSGVLDAASRDLERALRLGETVLLGGRAPSQISVGARMVTRSWFRLVSLLREGEIDPDVESRLIRRVPIIDREPDFAKRVVRMQYGLDKEFYGHLDRRVGEGRELHPLVLRLEFRFDRTLRSVARHYRDLLTELEKTPPERSIPRYPREPARSEKCWSLARGNSVGDIFMEHHLAKSVSHIEKFDRLSLDERACRLLLVLRRYERTHGALPPDLETLVAETAELDAVPLDPWSGEPIRYDRSARMLVSVGDDRSSPRREDTAALMEEPTLGRDDVSMWFWTIPALPNR